MKKLFAIAFVSVVALGTFAAGAQAATLGLAIPPSGSSTSSCMSDAVIAQAADDPATPYLVPGPGTITQWQTITPDDAAGADLSFLVLKPVGAAFSVVAVDSQTIDTPAPGVSSYTLATPIAVSGGETFGIYANDFDVQCYFHGGSTPGNDRLAGLNAPDPPAAGQTLARGPADSPGGFALNVAVTFNPAATPPAPAPTAKKKRKCKKKHKKRSAESAKKKKKKCKKKKKR